MTDKEPLKITLDDLGPAEPATAPAAESPAIPEKAPGKAREAAEQVGQRVAGAVKDTTSKVTQKIADTTTETANRTAEAVRDKVSETIQNQAKATADAVETRLREIDWKAEAQKGAEGGLRWLSQRLEALAERVKDEKK
jgi:hypothetical protein